MMTRNGVYQEEQDINWKEATESHIDEDKKTSTAGLLASAKTFPLVPNILLAVHSGMEERAGWCDTFERSENSKGFATLKMKVLALMEQNKTDDHMSKTDLRWLVWWYMHQGDSTSPKTISGLLTRYIETYQWVNQNPRFLLDEPICFYCCYNRCSATITRCGCLIVWKHCVGARENLTADAKLKWSMDL